MFSAMGLAVPKPATALTYEFITYCTTENIFNLQGSMCNNYRFAFQSLATLGSMYFAPNI